NQGSPTMTNSNNGSTIDWCELIERVPGKVSGRPVVRGTRIMPQGHCRQLRNGRTIEELREGFPTLSVDQIKRLIEFAHAQSEQPRH
ncbi:MAG: DUF433 domain-containing protein, partial [Acidobacteriota bacterium]|nr:DUF433 domain-containing protein [Acidobacteriota bacterium]